MSSVQPPVPHVPLPPAQSAPVEGEAVPADIVKLPPALASTDRALTLRGEVVATSEDGTVRINTPRGPVEVKLPQPVPQRGQTVEVQIPAGSPPRTAAVTLPPQNAQPLPAQPQPTPQPLPQQPQPPVQTLPPAHAPAPGTPAQTPVQQTPATMPRDEISVTPRPAQQGSAQPAPAQPGTPQAAQIPQLEPQGLLNFLKNSMSALLKSPLANAPQPANSVPQDPRPQIMAAPQQRPLQPGLMLRLSALPPGQSVSALTQQTTPQATPTQTSLPVLAPALQNLPTGQAAHIFQPQTAQPPLAQAPLQQTIQRPLLAPAGVTLAAPQGAQTPASHIDPAARLLMPALSAPALPVPSAGAPVQQQVPAALSLAAQIATPVPQQTADQPALQPQQPLILRPGTPAPALTQPMDVRIGAMPPVMPAATLQNPGVATLLHGTPQMPVLFAQVTGQTPQGLPVVELPTFTTAPDGTQKPATALMVLQFPARALPAAAILQMNILPPAQTAAALTAPSFAFAPAAADAMSWDVLDDVIRSHPAGQGANALAAALPKPGAAGFTAPVLMMAAALRSGDLSAWIGEKGIDALKTARRADALARISGDVAAAGRRMDDPAAPGEWKSLSLPMLYGQEVGRIQLYYRSFTQGEDGGGQHGKKGGTRFVMDLNLTRMGPLQIDGFSVGSKLDVTLRSEQALSPGMREAMRARYREAVGGIGFTGELNFNASADHKGWIVADDASRLRDARA